MKDELRTFRGLKLTPLPSDLIIDEVDDEKTYVDVIRYPHEFKADIPSSFGFSEAKELSIGFCKRS